MTGPGWGTREDKVPPEAETRLAFGLSMEACFLIFGDAENHSYLQSA